MNNSQATNAFLRTTILSIAIATIAATQGQAQALDLAPVPANLQPPAGNQAFLKVAAVGTQNYICLPAGWTFIGPQATLFVKVQWFGSTLSQQVGTHYLTPNPAETATNRPLWQSSVDSSIVWAKQADFADVDPTAIPWLLLQAAGNQKGPAGGTILSQTTWIQRVNTTGGLKPASACTVGAREFVPYTADYVFFRKTNN